MEQQTNYNIEEYAKCFGNKNTTVLGLIQFDSKVTKNRLVLDSSIFGTRFAYSL
jgi:hypothetical protein